METDPPEVAAPKQKRRWCQFSLRTLLILTVIVGTVSALVMHRVERKRRERKTLARIAELNGMVWYDSIKSNEARTTPSGPIWLRRLFGDNFFSEVSIVFLRGRTVTDSDIEPLTALTHLQQLNLAGTNVTDAGLGDLEGLTQLSWLCLTGSDVTNEGVLYFHTALPNCRVVWP